MKPIELNVKEVSEFQENHKVLYSYCSKTGRSLYLNLFGGFEIWKNGEKLFEHNQPYAVVEYFNQK